MKAEITGITSTLESEGTDEARSAYRRDYHRAYYHRTKERRRELALGHNVSKEAMRQARVRHLAKREAFIRAAKAKPCVDCGQQFPPRAMDFHHKTGRDEAGFKIADARSISLARLKAEIDKCVVLCAVCHRLRH